MALVCTEGHTINSEYRANPVHNRAHCEECGSPGITACPRCNQPIPGEYTVPHVFAPSAFVPPTFCGACGEPMPWTESRLKAARDLVEEFDELTPEDRVRLEESIAELVRDSPQVPVAVTRIKKIAMKFGKGSWTLLEKILTDVASDTAKKMLGLP